ncbi:hypothetical protein GLOTRDRAFT_95425 [Gloeophyllum trabeum ATCC 11539]|uniref:Uncharacterized protein n=1 Tax=Gloeophyllum trabeum (strain ATCC 11539 / FP-39264 / Madison 617) TaxID=670483 RepID=S7PYK0_GLOTA|nr:uncharacterized protein GLOTRDRAFT_95425 [Gloeophyllum trabeum ATCC 11539]EPQ52528.1 hypothetical protein GLOTRDRAFT_95425 [Gloeophyllum trabeum ATCC 11539]
MYRQIAPYFSFGSSSPPRGATWYNSMGDMPPDIAGFIIPGIFGLIGIVGLMTYILVFSSQRQNRQTDDPLASHTAYKLTDRPPRDIPNLGDINDEVPVLDLEDAGRRPNASGNPGAGGGRSAFVAYHYASRGLHAAHWQAEVETVPQMEWPQEEHAQRELQDAPPSTYEEDITYEGRAL